MYYNYLFPGTATRSTNQNSRTIRKLIFGSGTDNCILIIAKSEQIRVNFLKSLEADIRHRVLSTFFVVVHMLLKDLM